MKTEPFWTDAFPRPTELAAASDLPETIDVAIVGAGYTGLSAAYTLAGAGASVAVLDRHAIGWGASSRNGGMATPGIKQKLGTMIKWYGHDLARTFWQASLDAIDLIDALVREENIQCDWRRDGHLYLASKPSHFEQMKSYAQMLNDQFDHPVQLVEREQLHSQIGSDHYYGGLADKYSGGLQPAKYVFGLADAASAKGAVLCEYADVQAITQQGDRFTVSTDRGAIKANEVMVATNGYTDNLIPKLKSLIFPVGSYIIVTEPLPDDLQAEISPKGRMFYNSKNFINYFRLTPDGRMLWGGRNNLSTNLELRQSATILHEQMVQVFPQLHDYFPTYSWSGQLGLTFDLMPHIGQIDGIHYALGYAGHGLSIATYLGREIGRLLSGELSHSPFAEIDHSGRFFYRNRPWFLPIAAQYFRCLDIVR